MSRLKITHHRTSSSNIAFPLFSESAKRFFYTKSLMLVLGLFLCFFFAFTTQAQTIRYVKPTATGSGNGSSWANASADIQAMIDYVASNGSGSKEVWIAAGTYPNGNSAPTDPRDKTFYVRDGVKIYGGFSAIAPETTLAARSIGTNITILSGDFNGDDMISGSGSTLSITGNAENAFHLVIASAVQNAGGGVTVDGFTITGGNAVENSSSIFIGANFIGSYGSGICTFYGTNTLSNNILLGNSAFENGGAVFTHYGTNTLSNNTFLKNSAAKTGGGVYTYFGTNTFSNNIFSGNLSRDGGGGVYTHRGINSLNNNTCSGNSSSSGYGGGILASYGNNTLSNNTLLENSTTFYGGGIFTDGGTNIVKNNIFSKNLAVNGGGYSNNSGTITLTNNVFSENSATHLGGGVQINSGANTNIINNNTFSKNSAADEGGGIYTIGGINTLNNNIFFGNTKATNATVPSADYYVGGTNLNTLKNNLLQLASSNYPVSATGTYAIGAGASGNIHNQDPLFVSTTAGAIDLRLQAGSPCINAGITGVGIPTADITGATRTDNPDLGAYEYVAPPCTAPTATITVTNNCGNSVLDLTTNGASFAWSNMAVTQDITVSTSGTYTVTVTGTNACTATVSGVAAPKATPTASVTVTNNCGNAVLNLTTNGTSYAWSNMSTTEDITVSTSGTYTVTVTSANTCTTTTSGAAAPKVTPTASVSVSNNCGNAVLSATAGLTSYAWSNNAATADITVSNTANYIVTATAANGCTVTANGNSAPKALPIISMTTNSPGCGSVDLNVSGGDTYSFSGTGTTTPITTIVFGDFFTGAPGYTRYSAIRNVTSSGSYTVTVTNSLGCTAEQTTSVIVNPAVTVTVTNVTPPCGSATFTATGGGGTGTSPLTYTWSSNMTNVNGNTANLDKTGFYSVTVTDPSTGCKAIAPSTGIIGGGGGGFGGGWVFVISPSAHTVNAYPSAYAVTGGGSYCVGSGGVAIGLANSELDVNYQLKNGAVDVGTAVAGTGAAITFGLYGCCEKSSIRLYGNNDGQRDCNEYYLL
jgi:hypothetical protein